MLCPITNRECPKTQCAWWDFEERACVVKLFSRNLRYLGDRLGELGEEV